MIRATLAVPLAALILLALGGCSAAPAPTPSASHSALGAQADAVLAEFGIAPPASAKQLITRLEALPVADRPEGLTASVGVDALTLGDGSMRTAVPLPAGEFHLSVAPYLTRSHDCFYHSLTTCTGELGDTRLHVRIADAARGTVLVDHDVTTFANGYVEQWLPAGRELTLTVDDGRHSAVARVGTGADDPTCVTTLRLH
ncbi:CueP family metal-binding protein [Galbitalea sp. SE-J8]|uniref:CueP family metal-binding protein n=1 Tax=Galbitalea sp. SE-J8 TaxID=3054952 RepID=UPI00259CB288|nr:CueP family metal-binding protein [Galbitalea sp. SE-J8]MDM4763608.1 CueP family metal-binding protein [Galbitalea sp. SE-J8]